MFVVETLVTVRFPKVGLVLTAIVEEPPLFMASIFVPDAFMTQVEVVM